MSMKKLLSLLLVLILCASISVPALAAEGDDTGPTSGAEPSGEMASSVDPHIAPSDAPETAPIDPAAASDPEAPANDTEAPPETDETIPIDPNAETAAPGTETAETGTETVETTTIDDEMPLVVSFSDVPTTHTFYKGITYCAGKGIVGGYADGTFRPANTVTKNHFCAMLARAFYPDQVEKYSTDYYKDTFGTFGPTNMAMAQSGTLDSTSFRWQYTNAAIMGTGINRYDMAQLMTNIMKAKGFTASSAQKSAAQSKITDYKNIPSQYQDAVKNVYALGVIGGYGDGRFVGTNIMNRGQAAIVIQRMAQYAPVKGDQDNDTYDDGTEQKPKPSTGTNTGSNTSSSNTGSNTSNTGSTGTTTPKPDPKPETPAVRTLSNGKAITEANVTEILNQLQAKYPRKTDFSKGYAGLSSGRSPSKNCIDKIVSAYKGSAGYSCSTTIGCGGWAAFVADEIFGQTGVTWKKTTITNARPGDLMIDLDNSGYLKHVTIYVGESTDGFPKTVEVYRTGATTSKGVYKIGWANAYWPNVDVWTAYPD